MFRTTAGHRAAINDPTDTKLPAAAAVIPDSIPLPEDVLQMPPTRIDTSHFEHPAMVRSQPGAREQEIGRILVEAKRISATNAQRVLQVANKYRIRFGDAGIRLGVLKQEDVEYALGRQFAFPSVSRRDASMAREIIAAYAPNDPLTEALRSVRSQILLRSAGGPRANPLVAIVSAGRGDGRSFIAANLAVVFAQLGQRTLLIDADLRNPTIHDLFKLDNRIGLSTMLAGRSGIESVRRVEALPRLFVLPSGPTPPNPLELLENPAFRQVLTGADANFKAVIIDTPAGSVAADPQVVCAHAGSAVVVARSAHSRVDEAAKFAAQLRQTKANFLGMIFNERR